MSGSFSVGGLVSGLDTEALIDAYVDAKNAQLITPLEDRILELSSQQSALSTISDSVKSFEDLAYSLKTLNNFESRIANSSDTDKLLITNVKETASKGTYSVTVDQLAQADRNYFEGVADKDASQFGTGTVTITSSGSTITVDITDSNNTLSGISDAINAAGGPVTASIVDDGSASNPFRLVLTANSTGADSNITQDIGSVLSLTDDATLNSNSLNQGQDASIDVNGLTVLSETNTVADAIPGVTLSLLALHTDDANPLKVTVSADYTNPITTITNFINGYNTLVAAFKGEFDVDDISGQSSGILSSDITLQSAQNKFFDYMVSIHNEFAGNAYQAINELGITMDENNYLVIDQAELESALTTDSGAVKTFFQGDSANDGVADLVYDYSFNLTNSGDGIFTQKNDIWQDNIDDLLELIEEREDRIANFEETLRASFVYMEETLSLLEAQSSSIDALKSTLELTNGSS